MPSAAKRVMIARCASSAADAASGTSRGPASSASG
jgi:hypothetical protein